MPINAFGGTPGSGKTYGVMEHVIIPAVAQGRFILTNVEGLNIDQIYLYVCEKFYKGKIICLGHIRCCDRADPEKDDFFPDESALDKPMPPPDPESVLVNGGDLVVIDEATRYWAQGDKVKRRHSYFFREHRHFSNEVGHTCDLVVIDPDLSLLARALKGKVEMASVTHKPKTIGLNRYVVNIYRGCRLTGKPVQILGPYAFDKKIYSLYKSYSHDKAKEQSIDSRQNVFKNPRTWIVFALVFSVGAFSYWSAPSWMKGKPASVSSPPSSVVPVAPSVDIRDALRISGEVVLNGERWIVLTDGSGKLRLESPASFTGRGVFMVGNVQGHTVNALPPVAAIPQASSPVVGSPK